MTEPGTLLADYVKTGSEPAFRELVSRYIDLVYSTALRQVLGDRHLAEDVVQTVFLNLARKAQRLPTDIMLGGWLHQDTCNIAATLMRSERRRHQRERQAVEMNDLSKPEEGKFSSLGPVLDDAINKLEREDRTAILLRFFEQRDFRSVGEALGTSEDAARMRVNRSLDKLHSILSGEGVTLSAAAIAAGLATETVTAAPAGLVSGVAVTALAGAGATGVVAPSFVKASNLAHVKLALFGAVAVTALIVPLHLQHQANKRLQSESDLLRQQVSQLGALQAENQRLSNSIATVTAKPGLEKDELSELLRLRGEVGRLRAENRELARAIAARPAVDLLPGTEPPQFIMVAGEVQTPSRFLWTNGMTLAAAIELAHGFTQYADQSVCRIKHENMAESLLTTSDQSRQSLLLQPGDRIFIPQSAATHRETTPLELYTRVIKIDENALARLKAFAAENEQPGDSRITIRFLESNGIYLTPPKTAYLDPAAGTLMIRASLVDLDKVETALANLK